MASVIANANRGRNARAYKPRDFMPHYGTRRAQSDDEMRSRIELALRR